MFVYPNYGTLAGVWSYHGCLFLCYTCLICRCPTSRVLWMSDTYIWRIICVSSDSETMGSYVLLSSKPRPCCFFLRSRRIKIILANVLRRLISGSANCSYQQVKPQAQIARQVRQPHLYGPPVLKPSRMITPHVSTCITIQWTHTYTCSCQQAGGALNEN